jgi:membrane fusion protein, copper/silver efflux system
MKTRTVLIVSIALVMLAAGGYALWALGMTQGMKMAAPAAVASERKVLYWHDPMVPGQKFDKPGKSPFMDMQLVPVYADEADTGSGIAINPRVQQNLGIRIAEAKRGTLERALETVGTVAYNERDVAVVQARAAGFVERLHVRAPLDTVRQGQPLLDLYVPDWIAAQEEFLAVRSMAGDFEALREGAAQRMRLAGMSEEQVRLVRASGKVQPRITLTAPIGGVVSELAVREGMTVANGAPLFRINGLGTVWVNAEVPEGLAAQVRPGTPVEAHATAFPSETFKGRVSAIVPEVNAATRTLKARVEIANPKAQLVPGMFATVSFSPGAMREAVLVPTEAVIATGKRTVVVVASNDAEGKRRFAPVDVDIGQESGGQTEIRKGIEPGTQVVVSGQFLIDSESSLKAATTRLGGEQGSAAATAPVIHRGEGRIEAIKPEAVTLSHGPIPSMQWGAMTMEFKRPAGVPMAGAQPGSTVEFEFRQGAAGEFELTSVKPKGPAK